MSSTNKTTNLELSQFLGTDKPTWLGDYNGDMDKIDKAWKVLEDAIGEVEQSESSVEDRVSIVETTVAGLGNNVSILQGKTVTQDANIDQIHHEVVLNNEKIDQYADYSTDEHIVGKWIDGRDIYEKTIILIPTTDNVVENYNVIMGSYGWYGSDTAELSIVKNGDTSNLIQMNKTCYLDTINIPDYVDFGIDIRGFAEIPGAFVPFPCMFNVRQFINTFIGISQRTLTIRHCGYEVEGTKYYITYRYVKKTV